MSRREEHREAEEARARRSLEQHARRWSGNPSVYLILLAVALVAILVLMFL